MNVLVTGCAGFIGCKVSESLLKEGHAVIGVDNLNGAYDVRLKEWRLDTLTGREDFSFSRLDLVDRAAVRSLLDGTGTRQIDAIVNLAARAGVHQSVENPWVYYEANVVGTLNLLELCRERGVGKFVLASTSSLYGSHNPMPFREDADTSRPLSPYAASKKAAETLCYTYHHLHDLDVTVLRYFTVYGPAGRPDMSIFRFIRWIAEGEPVVLYGDGDQERDFTYVDDVAAGTLAALRPLGFDVINLGSDRPFKINDVISMVEELLGKKAKVQRQPTYAADVKATWADIFRAKQVLGWEPAITLEEGLERTVEWYQQNRRWIKQVLL